MHDQGLQGIVWQFPLNGPNDIEVLAEHEVSASSCRTMRESSMSPPAMI